MIDSWYTSVAASWCRLGSTASDGKRLLGLDVLPSSWLTRCDHAMRHVERLEGQKESLDINTVYPTSYMARASHKEQR